MCVIENLTSVRRKYLWVYKEIHYLIGIKFFEGNPKIKLWEFRFKMDNVIPILKVIEN